MTKTLSFAILHSGVAFMIGWLFTGSWLVSGALALVEPACNTVVFHFHEKCGSRSNSGAAKRPIPWWRCEALADTHLPGTDHPRAFAADSPPTVGRWGNTPTPPACAALYCTAPAVRLIPHIA